MVDKLHQRLVEYFVYERAFPRAGYAGYADKQAERYADVYFFEVVLLCSPDGEPFACMAAKLGGWDGNFPAKVGACERVLALLYFLGRAACHYPAPMDASARP